MSNAVRVDVNFNYSIYTSAEVTSVCEKMGENFWERLY